MQIERSAIPEAVLAVPENHCGTGILTVAGSSGRIEEQRASIFAEQGALALSIRWFGGPGQPAVPRLIPLETFVAAVDRLARECDRLVVSGTSFGAEAALQLAAVDERVDACMGFAPSSVRWSHVDEDGSQVSHWTWQRKPLPAVELDTSWEPESEPPAYLDAYRRSLRIAPPDVVERAGIPVERIGQLLLVAGGDDQVWPATQFADAIAQRRRAHALETTVLTRAGAGHRAVLPGEAPVAGGQSMRRGGTPQEDARLGALAWPHLLRLLTGSDGD